MIVETAPRTSGSRRRRPRPAVALGAFEVTPLELARAYVPFASGGTRPGAIRSVHAVYRADGSPILPDEEPAHGP